MPVHGAGFGEAQAGIHVFAARAFEPWIPAFAGYDDLGL
jgi:hypothetical protein